tara:strand:- start:389 stop:913 length:525 start_codon:yes stop_codon:yes gene_type:complete
MTKKNNIIVLGKNAVKMTNDQLRDWGPIVSIGHNRDEFSNVMYVFTSDEQELRHLCENTQDKFYILTTPDLYKKYVFYDRVHNVVLPGHAKNLEITGKTDDQTFALMTALGVCKERVLLFGYDISSQKVLRELKSVILTFTETEFLFICNPPKTKRLDHLPNAECRYYKEMSKL